MVFRLHRKGWALVPLVVGMALEGRAVGAGFGDKYGEAQKLVAQGKKAEAAQALEEASQLGRAEGMKTVAHVLLSAGNLYLAAGQVDQARRAYGKCASEPGLSPEIKAQAERALAGLPAAKPVPRPKPVVDKGPRIGEKKRKQIEGDGIGEAAPMVLPKGALPETEARAAMIPIPTGVFMMGSPVGEKDRVKDEVQHRVTISRGFWLGRTEVTQGQYRNVVGTTPSNIWEPDLPVVMVSWHDAVAYCNNLSAKEQLEACYQAAGGTVKWVGLGCKGYRLPTEAEWEYAARAGQGTIYAGSNQPGEVAWYEENSGSKTHPVAKKRANEWGLYDMSGNIREWVWDCYGNYDVKIVTDPIRLDRGHYRIVRGGSWFYDAHAVRVAYRLNIQPAGRYDSVGFRVARSLP